MNIKDFKNAIELTKKELPLNFRYMENLNEKEDPTSTIITAISKFHQTSHCRIIQSAKPINVFYVENQTHDNNE